MFKDWIFFIFAVIVYFYVMQNDNYTGEAILESISYDCNKISYSENGVLEDARRHNALCSLSAKYISGIECFAKNSKCRIYANTENIKIVFNEPKEMIALLPIGKINKIQVFDDMATRLTTNSVIDLQNIPPYTNKFLSISYTSQKNKNMEIILEYNYAPGDRLYNENALKQKNIVNFINHLII